MKRFQTVTEIPSECIAAPSLFFAPRPGAKPVGSFEGSQFFRRADVSDLRTKSEWRRDGRTIKAGEKPIAQRGFIDPEGVFAIWQTD